VRAAFVSCSMAYTLFIYLYIPYIYLYIPYYILFHGIHGVYPVVVANLR
jgi:hypothetical protein